MGSPINRVTNANVYLLNAVAGLVNWIGRAEEVELPQVKKKMVEHKGLGLYFDAKLKAGGTITEAKIKWASFYPDVIGAACKEDSPGTIMVRANVQQFGAGGVLVGEVPLVATMTGVFDETPSGGKITKHENSDNPSQLTVYYYKLAIAGADLIEVDVFANIFKVEGQDQLSQFRANQGG